MNDINRVAEGLSLESHAARCAEIFGIPGRLIKRAQHVRYVSMRFSVYSSSMFRHLHYPSQLLSTHEIGQLLDEAMSEKEVHDLQDAEAVCRKFLAWDLQDEKEQHNVKMRLANILGKTDVYPDNKDREDSAEMKEN
jgi:DNA mismatch repair protein MSH5